MIDKNDSISSASSDKSPINKLESPRSFGSPKNLSPFSRKHAQKSKGQRNSFQAKPTGRSSFLKAAIIQNIQNKGEFDDKKDVASPRRHSYSSPPKKQIQFFKQLTFGLEDQDDEDEIEDEGSTVNSDYVKFVKQFSKTKKTMLETKTGFSTPSPKNINLEWKDVI